MKKLLKCILIYLTIIGVVGCKNINQTNNDLSYESDTMPKTIELMDFSNEGKKLNDYLNDKIPLNEPYHFIWIFENLRSSESELTSNPNEEMFGDQSMLQINLSVENQRTVIEDELVEVAYLVKVDSKEFNESFQLQLRNKQISFNELKEYTIYETNEFIIVNIINILYPNCDLLEISEQKIGYKQTHLEGLNEIANTIIEEVVNFYAQ